MSEWFQTQQLTNVNRCRRQHTCTVAFLHIQGEAAVTATTEAADGVPALSMNTDAGEHFTFIDVYE